LPDFGHSALWVGSDGSGPSSYVSFWPERESLVGAATRPWKPRETRHPASYRQEADRDGAYMQRPADFSDPLRGLDEARLHDGWEAFRDKPYVLETFNCSNVTHTLLAAAMPRSLYARLRDEGDALPEELGILDHATAVSMHLRKLLLHKFASERPLQVRLFALTYEKLAAAVVSGTEAEPGGA
jgi:hypothetical protein